MASLCGSDDMRVSGETQVKVKMERAGVFHPDHARAALELLHVRGMPQGLRPADRLNILNTMVRVMRSGIRKRCDVFWLGRGVAAVTCAVSSGAAHCRCL